MNRHSLLIVIVGLSCYAGPLPARQAVVEPVQVADANYGAGAGMGVSSDGTRLYCFDSQTLHWIDLKARGDDKSLPLPKIFRGERIYTGVHVQDDVWMLAMDRWPWDVKQDGFKARFVLYDFAADKVLADWAGHEDDAILIRAAFVPKQDWLISADSLSERLAVCFWDRKTRKKAVEISLRREFHLAEKEELECIAVDPTSSFLAFCMEGGVIHIWDLEKKKWLSVVDYGRGRCSSFCFVGSDALALTYWTGQLDFSGRVRGESCFEVYDWKTAKSLVRMNGDFSQVTASPDGRTMAVSERKSDGTYIRLWDASATREIIAFRAYNGIVGKMIFTPDGKNLICLGWEDTLKSWKIKVWDVEAILAKSQSK